jgi:hypothetical protein
LKVCKRLAVARPNFLRSCVGGNVKAECRCRLAHCAQHLCSCSGNVNVGAASKRLCYCCACGRNVAVPHGAARAHDQQTRGRTTVVFKVPCLHLEQPAIRAALHKSERFRRLPIAKRAGWNNRQCDVDVVVEHAQHFVVRCDGARDDVDRCCFGSGFCRWCVPWVILLATVSVEGEHTCPEASL